MVIKKTKVSRQAKWAKGKANLIILDEESKEKLMLAVKANKNSVEGEKTSKSSVIRDLIKNHL